MNSYRFLTVKDHFCRTLILHGIHCTGLKVWPSRKTAALWSLIPEIIVSRSISIWCSENTPQPLTGIQPNSTTSIANADWDKFVWNRHSGRIASKGGSGQLQSKSNDHHYGRRNGGHFVNFLNVTKRQKDCVSCHERTVSHRVGYQDLKTKDINGVLSPRRTYCNDGLN